MINSTRLFNRGTGSQKAKRDKLNIILHEYNYYSLSMHEAA